MTQGKSVAGDGAVAAGVVGPLQEGPIDIVGDVHGEAEALGELLSALGYDGSGGHSDGRRLVFVGDLCDRGPDSPAVLDRVAELVALGRAQCVLGNHELNVLLGAAKRGNGWYFDRNHDVHNGEFLRSAAATAERRAAWRAFIGSLPLALERHDLRIVHACWHPESIAMLEQRSSGGSCEQLYEHFQRMTHEWLRESGVEHRAAAEISEYRHKMKDPAAAVPLLEATAWESVTQQNGNPIKVLTSGLESVAKAPVFADGKWRMTDRVRWWEDYQEAPAVVVGHYWRTDARGAVGAAGTGPDGVFGGYAAYAWMGPRRNVYCVDYSVGKRYHERLAGRGAPYESRLAALRWPERELVFDDGERVMTEP